MGRSMCIAVAVLLAGGCASHPAGKPDASWMPSCRTLGCHEQIGAGDVPAGAELNFTQCRDEGLRTYRYEKVDGGWKLVSLREVSDDSCN